MTRLPLCVWPHLHAAKDDGHEFSRRVKAGHREQSDMRANATGHTASL